MPFKISDRHIDEFHRLGFTNFENLIPPTLLRELRNMAEQARAICREKNGPQAQRLQPIQNYDLDLKPYYEYAELTELVEAIEKILGPDAIYAFIGRESQDSHAGILFEPEEKPYCTQWHRDWRDNIPGLSIKEWEAQLRDLRLFNQVNTPLYDDNSLWVIPGSHLRHDLPSEIRRFPERPINRPEMTDEMINEDIEQVCLEYCLSMSGAVQVNLRAGDFLLYRNSLWHIGSYTTYRKRATIHDSVWTQEFREWSSNWPKREDGGKEMENPNLDTHEYKQWKAAQCV